MEKVEVNGAEPLAVWVDVAYWPTGLGRTTIYELMKAGKLRSVKIGRARLIDRASLSNLVGGLARQDDRCLHALSRPPLRFAWRSVARQVACSPSRTGIGRRSGLPSRAQSRLSRACRCCRTDRPLILNLWRAGRAASPQNPDRTDRLPSRTSRRRRAGAPRCGPIALPPDVGPAPQRTPLVRRSLSASRA